MAVHRKLPLAPAYLPDALRAIPSGDAWGGLRCVVGNRQRRWPCIAFPIGLSGARVPYGAQVGWITGVVAHRQPPPLSQSLLRLPAREPETCEPGQSVTHHVSVVNMAR